MSRCTRSLFCAIALSAVCCSRDPSPVINPAPHVPAAWSYDGANGPARWDKLDSEYAQCGFGTTQSPVDISNAEPHDIPNIVFHYQPAKLDIQNTGHTIQIKVDEGGSIEANGESYDLIQLELHAPSEHSIYGRLADAELQLVHRNAAGQLAIIAVLLRVGSEDKALRAVWDNLPSEPGDLKTVEGKFNLEEVLPGDRRTYRYEGSLTTPPCTEIVSWLVMRDAMHVSAKQLEGFIHIFKSNNRPVQPLNQRTVILDNSAR